MPWFFGRSIRDEARSSVRSSNISIGGAMRSSVSAHLCFALVLLAAAGGAQVSHELPGSTEDHVAAKGWWPTKATGAGNAYSGASACCASPNLRSAA
jgi:hypothetical protein